MDHPLYGSLLKIERAVCEIDKLRWLQDVLWNDSDHQIVRAELNPKSGKYVYRASGDFSLSMDWGVDIGEIVHNLRSALDSVVYRLVLANKQTPTNTTQFPIFLVRKSIRTKPNRRGKPVPIPQFEGKALGNGRSMLRGVCKEHQAMIERLQPYHRRRTDGAKGRKHPLYWLKEINNADKHRLIQVVGYRGTGTFWSGAVTDDDDMFSGVLFSRTKVMKNRAKFLEAPPEMHMGPRIIPLVVFAEGGIGIKGRMVTNHLRLMSEAVAEVVSLFWDEV